MVTVKEQMVFKHVNNGDIRHKQNYQNLQKAMKHHMVVGGATERSLIEFYGTQQIPAQICQVEPQYSYLQAPLVIISNTTCSN